MRGGLNGAVSGLTRDTVGSDIPYASAPMKRSCSIPLRDPHDVEVLDRLQARFNAQGAPVLVVHDGLGSASFFTYGADAVLRERMRAAIETELGPAWSDHFGALP